MTSRANKNAESLRREDVVIVEGAVRKIPTGMANENSLTYHVEVLINKIVSINRAQTPPIEIDDRLKLLKR